MKKKNGENSNKKWVKGLIIASFCPAAVTCTTRKKLISTVEWRGGGK